VKKKSFHPNCIRLLESLWTVELYTNLYLPARTAFDEKETGRLIDLLDNAVSLMTQIGKRLSCCNIAIALIPIYLTS
jgi:hypothetical protein